MRVESMHALLCAGNVRRCDEEVDFNSVLTMRMTDSMAAQRSRLTMVARRRSGWRFKVKV